MAFKIKSKDGRHHLTIARDLVKLSFADRDEANYAKDFATSLVDPRHGTYERGPEPDLKRRMSIERRVYDALLKANLLTFLSI